MYRRGIALVFVLSLAGCRADVVEPLPDRHAPSDLEIVTGGRQEWTPAVRLTRLDGSLSTDHVVRFDNEFYYDPWLGENELAESLISQRTLYVADGVAQFAVGDLVPPFSVQTSIDGIPIQLFDVDPAPGDSIAIDVRNPTRWIDLRVPEFVDEWLLASATITWRHRPEAETIPERQPTANAEMVTTLRRGLNPMVLSDTATMIVMIDLSWLSPSTSVEWHDYVFIESAPGDTMTLDPRLSEVPVRVLQGGAPLTSLPLLFSARDAETGLRFGDGAESVRLVGTDPVVVPVFGDLVDLQIRSTNLQYFVPLRHVFDATTADTVTVDLGSDDLEVRVEDSRGRPLQGRTVTVRRLTGSIGPASLTTDAAGRCHFVVDPDFYDIDVRGGVAWVDTTVVLSGDTVLLLVERGEQP